MKCKSLHPLFLNRNIKRYNVPIKKIAVGDVAFMWHYAFVCVCVCSYVRYFVHVCNKWLKSVILRLCCFIRRAFDMCPFMASEQRPFNPQGFHIFPTIITALLFFFLFPV